MARSIVAVLHATPETFLDDVRRASGLAGAERRLRTESQRTLLVETGPPLARPGQRTTPWSLDAVARPLVGDSWVLAPPGRRSDAHFERAHLSPVLAAGTLRAKTADPSPEETLGVDPAVPLWTAARGSLPRVDQLRNDTEAILVAPLRSCRRWGVRGALDLAAASLGPEYDREDRGPDLLVELYTLFRHLHPRLLAVIDLTVCGAEDLRDRPSVQNLLVVSRDPVAADAVAARLLGMRAEQLPALALAARRGLGRIESSAIDVRGEDISGKTLGVLPRGFRPGSSRGRSPVWLRRSGASLSSLTRPLSRAFNVRPQWRQFERTPWGRLLEDYRRGELPWT